MKVEAFQAEAEEHLAALENLVLISVKKTGDKEEDCQQVTLLNALKSVDQAVNGTTEEDMT